MKPSSKSIDAYRDKRDFNRTPEPSPEAGARESEALRFVVHRHEARRLHYDLRLEMAGVLKSWAVPRGFSYDPLVKRLAVRTEDHPLAYENFEGVIPKGEYGGGTMTIWDRGRYDLVQAEDGPAAVEEGKLEIRLRGRKLRGEWHLVKTRSENHEWIVFKARDRYARKESDKAPFFDLSSAREAPLFERLEPMKASGERGTFSDPNWLFEVDFQGRRAAIRKAGDEVRLVTPDGEDLGARLPEIVEDARRLRSENAWLDGVVVVSDDSKRPSRQSLESRLAGASQEIAVFYAFDLLFYEEWDLRPVALAARKELLSTLSPLGLQHLLYVDHVQGRGEDFCEVTRSAGLTGVIAKRAESTYASGRSAEWVRIPVLDPTDEPPPHDLVTALRTMRPTKRKIAFTNLDKVLWPDDGFTKGDLIRYYEQVAETLLPYLYERPVHMLRYPDGIRGKSFYQKDAPDHIPDWVVTETIESDDQPIHYIVCNDRDTLILMANLASIDLHPWLSRRDRRDTPDWAVFDLDAKKSPFSDVVKIARTIGKILRGIGLRPYLKTSGATGIHIYVPVLPIYTYEHTRTFCQMVSTFVAREHKDIATVERLPSRRGNKVYVDFGQNRRGQTVVPPYAVRPRPKAPVSAPLTWDELDVELDPTAFNMKTILARLAKEGDLFQGALRDPQDLLAAVQAFQEVYL
ncbi:MAG TPA: non-homologous end-joining DNA ligase [Vicinamibacteria bacterium]|nr:non-homologous end-joining DNA ligase [Vicinamibacteria bacterium]